MTTEKRSTEKIREGLKRRYRTIKRIYSENNKMNIVNYYIPKDTNISTLSRKELDELEEILDDLLIWWYDEKAAERAKVRAEFMASF